MKKLSLLLLCFLFVGAGLFAQTVTITLKGKVILVQDQDTVLHDAIKVNDSLTGTVVYYTNLADSRTDTTVGVYRNLQTPAGISVKIGTLTFQTNPGNVNFLVSTSCRTSGGAFKVISYNNQFSVGNDYTLKTISWQLDDKFCRTLKNDSVVRKIDLNKFTQNPALAITASTNYTDYFIRGVVTEITGTIRDVNNNIIETYSSVLGSPDPVVVDTIPVAKDTIPVVIDPTLKAQTITIALKGKVTQVDDYDHLLNNAVKVNDSITGTIVYYANLADNNTDNTVGDYRNTTSPAGMSVKTGPLTFQTDAGNINLLTESVDRTPDRGGDGILFRSYHNVFPVGNEYNEKTIEWQLDNALGTALKNDSVTRKIDLNKFTQMSGFTIDAIKYESDFFIRGLITEITGTIRDSNNNILETYHSVLSGSAPIDTTPVVRDTIPIVRDTIPVVRDTIPVIIDPTSETITDFDGNVYNTVKIGTQTWQKENLKSLHYADGTLIPDVHVYNNVANNANVYGRLYNWPATMHGSSSSTAIPSGVQGACPAGYHVPSDSEWNTLIEYLGGVGVAGGKMKETSSLYWNSPNVGADNSSNFNGRGAGCFSKGVYLGINHTTAFWTSTEYYETFARYTFLQDLMSGAVVQNDGYKTSYLSVRCLKNATQNQAQTVTIALKGKVTRVDDYNNLLNNAVKVNDSITGNIVYYTDLADGSTDITVGDYRNTKSPAGMLVKTGPLTFQTDAANIDLLTESVDRTPDRGGDGIVFISYQNVFPVANNADNKIIAWQLDNYLGTALKNDSVIRKIDLNKFTQMFGLTIDARNYGSSYFIRGLVTEITGTIRDSNNNILETYHSVLSSPTPVDTIPVVRDTIPNVKDTIPVVRDTIPVIIDPTTGTITDFDGNVNNKLKIGDVAASTNSSAVSSVAVYPNPASETLYLRGIAQDAQVFIYDLGGKMVLNQQISGNSIDIKNLQTGIYMIKIEGKEGVIIKKFVKQ